MTDRNTLWLAALLGLITFALFAPALGYQYVNADDIQYTIETPQVASGLSAAHVRWAFTTIHESWYSPLLWISLMADSSLFGPTAFGYHLTNLLLHTANALLLFWIFVRLTRSPFASFFAAALWSLHPLRIESVAWIAERKDVLSGFFFLLAIWTYLRWVEQPVPARRWLVFLCMLGGMLSKTILVVLPPLLLLLDAWPLRRISFPASRDDLRRWKPFLLEKAPLFALMLAGIVLTLFTHHHAHDNAPPLSAAARIALIAPAYWAHLQQILWPAHLSMLYPVRYPSAWIGLASWFALLWILWAGWKQRHIRPFLFSGGLWFLVAMGPVIRGIRFDEQSSYPDRYTYLSAMGLSLLLAGWLATIRSRRQTGVAGGVAALVLAALAVRSALYLPCWENYNVMAPILIRQVPDHPFANNMYGQMLALHHKPDEAIDYFKKATHWHVEAICNLATALLHAGRPAEALPVALKASAHPKAPPEAFLALGICHLQLDQAADAIPPLQRATQLMPGFPLAWQLLYRAYLESDNPAAAKACLQRLRQMNVLDVLDFNGLVGLYTRTWLAGNPRLAWPFFANNFRRHPQNVLLHNNAAWLIATTDNPPAPAAEALRIALIARSLAGEGHPDILDTLAAAQAANGDFDDASQTARQALRLLESARPENPSLRQGLEHRLSLYQRREPYREPSP